MLNAQKSASFDQPFDMLEACHERLHRTLGLLARLREHLPAHGADDQARQAARDVMKYFDQAAPQHHQDEELHVFPPLLAQDAGGVRDAVLKLQQDHLRMDTQWHAAREVLARIAAGELAALEAAHAATLDAFAALYASHIETEEQLAYPSAKALLDAAARQAMGEEMAGRRGVKI